MIQIELVSKGKGDTKPTINTSDLYDRGLLNSRTKVNDGDVFTLKLVNSGGIVATQEFKASRGGATLMAKDGWNDYLFGTPTCGDRSRGIKPKTISVGVCSLVKGTTDLTGGRGSKDRERVDTFATEDTTRQASFTPALSAIQKLLRANDGNKAAAARELGVHPRTLGRMIERAEAEASKRTSGRSAPKKSASGKKSKKVKSKKRSRR